MIKITFIRHGATEGNLAKRYIGRTDEPLSNIGIAKLKNQATLQVPDYLFVSPMLRTIQTADILFPQQTKIIIQDLSEMDFGIFENKTANDLSSNPQYQTWVDNNCLTKIPNGEDPLTFKSRACNAFLRAMSNVRDNQNVAFIVHGGIIMSILEAYALPKKEFYAYHIKNGEHVSYRFNPKNFTLYFDN